MANGLSASSNGGGLFSQGKVIDYFYNLTSIGVPVITLGSVPLLLLPRRAKYAAPHALTLGAPAKPTTPDPSVCAVIDALKHVPNTKAPCKLVDLSNAPTGPRSASVYVGQDTPRLGLDSAPNSDLFCSVNFDVASKPSPGEKYALMGYTLSYPSPDSCESLTFHMCALAWVAHDVCGRKMR